MFVLLQCFNNFEQWFEAANFVGPMQNDLWTFDEIAGSKRKLITYCYFSYLNRALQSVTNGLNGAMRYAWILSCFYRRKYSHFQRFDGKNVRKFTHWYHRILCLLISLFVLRFAPLLLCIATKFFFIDTIFWNWCSCSAVSASFFINWYYFIWLLIFWLFSLLVLIWLWTDRNFWERYKRPHCR